MKTKTPACLLGLKIVISIAISDVAYLLLHSLELFGLKFYEIVVDFWVDTDNVYYRAGSRNHVIYRTQISLGDFISLRNEWSHVHFNGESLL